MMEILSKEENREDVNGVHASHSKPKWNESMKCLLLKAQEELKFPFFSSFDSISSISSILCAEIKTYSIPRSHHDSRIDTINLGCILTCLSVTPRWQRPNIISSFFSPEQCVFLNQSCSLHSTHTVPCGTFKCSHTENTEQMCLPRHIPLSELNEKKNKNSSQ